MERVTFDPPAGTSPLLETWIANPDAARKAAVRAGPDWHAAVQQAGARVQRLGMLVEDAVAAAVLDPHGNILWADKRIAQWLCPDALSSLAAYKAGNASGIVVESGQDGAPILIVDALAQAVARWPLPEVCRAWLQQPNAARIKLVVSVAQADGALGTIARAHGLTRMEARLAVALVRSGDLRRAATLAGLAYSTARQAFQQVLRKLGQTRQQAAVSLLSRSACGLMPDADEEEACLIDLFGLRPREAQLTRLLCDGATRNEAARAIGISPAAAKDAFDRIFVQLNVTSSAELARLTAEARAAHLIAMATGGEIALGGPNTAPLRFLARPKAGVIAISDHGPAANIPVFLLHSSATTRHASRRFIARLQQAGLRPIAIDRPGFGLSDMIANRACPFEDAADDMALVMDALDLPNAHLLARGGAHAALAFARLYPGRLGRVVLINPDTNSRRQTRKPGLLGAVKEIYARHPERLRDLARMGAAYTTPQRLARMLQSALRANPADLAAILDPTEFEDYQRSVALFGTGRLEGFIREQSAYAAGMDVGALDSSHQWQVLIGARDPLHHGADMLSYWSARLPGGNCTSLPDGGRFLHLTHAGEVIGRLRA